MSLGILKALSKLSTGAEPTRFPIQPPVLPTGVVPKGKSDAPVLGMDNCLASWGGGAYDMAYGAGMMGFPGYTFLAMLATRAEYRAMARAYATEIVREWINLSSANAEDKATQERITEIMQQFSVMRVRNTLKEAFEDDGFNGAGQIFIEITKPNGVVHDPEEPLILSNKTIPKKSTARFVRIHPMWTTPQNYNTLNPADPYFYKPQMWYMMGKKVHASRLLRIVTRPLPDVLKAAFNFGGISLSQIAEPFVNNWLQTKQSIADLVKMYSTSVLKTNMSQVLNSGGDEEIALAAADNLATRAHLFTALRANRGLMLLDKDSEEFVQVNTPLSTLDALQSQSLEHLCTATRIPAVILTGLSPSGLNVSTDGEMGAWRDVIAGMQESDARDPLETMLQVVQLCMYGEIDPSIVLNFNPLQQMTPKELADLRKADSDRDANYVNMGAVAPDEVRAKLAHDPESGYHGLDLNREIETDDEDDGSGSTGNDGESDGPGKHKG